jgi:predicted CXXCH cytochrome family protein
LRYTDIHHLPVCLTELTVSAFFQKMLFIGLLLLLPATGGLHARMIQHHAQPVEGEAGYSECLACHDGVLAPNASPCLATVCFFRGPHPVARPYPPPDKSREFSTLEEAERLGIPFPGGQIDCISCHDLNDAGRYHLRLGTDNSRLCFACHRK